MTMELSATASANALLPTPCWYAMPVVTPCTQHSTARHTPHEVEEVQ